MESRLGRLQLQLLDVLAGLGWTLTGGGALVGFHLGHRVTRDLDLFWKDQRSLERIPEEVEARLRGAGLAVQRLQTGRTFCRILVVDGEETLPLDLVVDVTPQVEAPVEVRPGVWVDTPYEILVNKLTALLSRWAVRDLIDVQALEAAGFDLERAMADAPKKDAGFSPATLAWVLDTLPENELGQDLEDYRAGLVARLLSEPR